LRPTDLDELVLDDDTLPCAGDRTDLSGMVLWFSDGHGLDNPNQSVNFLLRRRRCAGVFVFLLGLEDFSEFLGRAAGPLRHAENVCSALLLSSDA
jgi:hypothetical protein